MFTKPFRIKSSSQMKGSDKKKFKADIRKSFPYFSDPEVDQDALNELIPNKEELLVTKIETFGGDAVLLYQKQKNVTLFFELEKAKEVFPTLYTLWQCPGLVPMAFPTYPPVLAKLANGADLMLPGVVVNEALGIKAYCEGKIKKGDQIGVFLTTNKALVAIGRACLSSEDMYMSGKRGKALNVLHCLGDQLWVHFGKPALPELGVPENIDASDEAPEDIIDQEEEIEEKKLDNDVEVAIAELQVEEKNEQLLDLDDILEDAFLRACKTLNTKKTEFPLLTSNFFRTHIVPACPPHCDNLDVKKTKWKKLSKFLAEKQAQGFLKISEAKKGVETITEINQDHPDVVSYRVVKYDKPASEANKPENAEYEPPIINEIYIVPGGDVALFFKALKVEKGCGMTAQDVRECVRNYVTENGLQHPDDKTVVNLDPVLAQAVLVKGENNVVTFKWEKLHSRIQSKMSKGYSIQFGLDARPTVCKGKLDLIEMIIGNRSGNKKVTLVQNLDVFGINLQEFAHKCQVGVAASTSIHEAANKKKANGNPVIEVLVQGNQAIFVAKLLCEHYKIPRKYIRGLELAVEKKGKK